MTQQQYDKYILDNGHKDFINNYDIYCAQDTRILSLGLIKMSEEFFKLEKINILNYLTAPSIAFNLFVAGAGTNIFQQEPENFDAIRSVIEQKFALFIQLP
jgi:hypothetical protein